MPIQGLRFNINSLSEAHLSFQATGSFTAYNPNDGVANIALDRTATALDYDHKLPSQSGGKFPGPINSYLSIYYVDQSGANTGGQVIVYASPEAMNIPYFWSIGRALQIAGTTLDITSGSQPQPPPANTARLWVDGNGDLHLLSSGNVDNLVYDSSNIGAVSLGADLYGTIAAGHIAVQNASAIYGKDNTNTNRFVYQPTSDNFNGFFCGTAGLLFVNSANTVRIGSMDNSGNFQMNGQISGATFNATNNHYYFQNNTGISVYWDGTFIHSTHSFVNDGTAYCFANNGGIYIQWNGYINTSHAITVGGATNSPAAYLALPPRIGTQISLYDGGTGNCYGLGVNSNELTLITAGTSVGFRAPSNSAATFAHFETAGNLVLEGANSFLYFHNNKSVYLYQNYPWLEVHGFGINNFLNMICSGSGFWATVGTTNNNGQSFFCAGGAGGPTGWQIISSKKFKTDIIPILDALGMVMGDVHGYHFTLDHPDMKGNLDPHPEYGFIGEEWLEVAPDLVHQMDKGVVNMMDYGQVTAILFEAFKEYVTKTDLRLGALEGAA